MNLSLSIQGMTCSSCVKAVSEKLSNLPNVTTVNVSLEKKRVDIVASRNITLSEVQQALAGSKYSVSENESKKSFIEIYKPLLIILTFIIFVSLAYQNQLEFFNSHLFMNHIMAGFFISLSFFKFLDLKAFAVSFSGYDPIAKRVPSYGLIYPFIEFTLGLMYIAGIALPIANVLTILVLSITTIGVYKKLQMKSAFQCACLGTTFNLPLSNVTITENVVMILMAAYSLMS